jgi:hypothetical protein
MAKALNMPVPENLSHSAYLLEMLSDSETTRPQKATAVPRTKQPVYLTSQFDRSTITQNDWPWSDVSVIEKDNSSHDSFRGSSARERLPSPPPGPSPITPIPPTEPFSSINRRTSVYKICIVILIIVILLTSFSTATVLFLRSHKNAPGSEVPSAGYAYFVNNDRLTGNSNQAAIQKV